jgi:hypothetical protein
MSDWRPISEYPHDGEDGGWGDEALLLVPAEYGPYRLIGWLEAGMWLARAPDDPVAMCDIIPAPTHFMPLGEMPPAEPGFRLQPLEDAKP